MMPYIDFHTHLGTSQAAFYDDSGEQALLPYCRGTQMLLEGMRSNGIEKSVVFSVPMLSAEQQQANEEVLHLIHGNDRLIPFAFLDPRLKESPQLLEDFIAQGCKGLKLHPVCHGYVVGHKLCYPTMDVAQAHHLPVLVHSGWGEYGEIRFIAKLAKDFKDLQIIIGHMIEFKDIFSLVPPLANVSVETSYSSHPRRIAQAVAALSADRVIFGSDFPCGDQGFELFKILHTSIPDGDKEKILYKNAQRILNL